MTKNYDPNYYYDTPEPSWAMTDKEIMRSYRLASDRTAQVRVLAELNARSLGEVVEKLESLGYDMQHARNHYGRRLRNEATKWSKAETELLMRLWQDGERDYDTIARTVGRSRHACKMKIMRLCGYEK